MKTNPANPFLVAGYQGPAYFCDREAETAEIVSALSNGRNVTLVSPRRMGKTGLIHHAFGRATKSGKDCGCFYIDIFATRNLAEFASALAKSVAGKLDDFSGAAVRRLAGFFRSLRPQFSIDPKTGAPEMTLDIRPGDSEQGVEDIFKYLRKTGRQCRIAIDEFQQILEYPEKNVEALLRTQTQSTPNVTFVFAGSAKHLMDAMFSSAKRPFYQSAQKIVLREIPLDAYRGFAASKFAAAGKRLPAAVFDHVYGTLSGHTWYVQLVMNILYSRAAGACSVADADRVMEGILNEESATYKTYCGMLTAGQLRVLRAVAVETVAKSPSESAFLRRHELGAASSVRLALNALCEKSILLKDENGGYSVYDRFFGLWLKRV